MYLIKRLDSYVLKKFLVIFLGAFFITLFVFMMQFTWRYVDELIGKGLTVDILAEFFWYMGLTIVPMSLPLSILLASLITFGNLGEKLELLAMKAAGVPLLRVMTPIFVFVLMLMTMSYYFQNKTSPEAQLKLRTLLLSMRQTSPALEIPEGVFYNGVPGYSLFVEKKEISTGMLYGLMVYKMDEGFDKAQIVVADSGRMEMTTDRMHLALDIWGGEQFENLRGEQMQAMGTKNTPYDRETFSYKRFIIDFDTNFEKMDEEQLKGMASAKNLKQIEESVDSVNRDLDSIAKRYYMESKASYYRHPSLSKKDEQAIRRIIDGKVKKKGNESITFDTLVAHLPSAAVQAAEQQARSQVSAASAELEWKAMITEDGDAFIRSHWIRWHEKFTLSLACLIFFLVGAPLGAIIRKGGLGMPAVVSVIIFILYNNINTGGMKMARDGSLNMVVGMWMSTVILSPLGIFLAYKANNDSVLFNLDNYLNIIKRWIGLRGHRNIYSKEVVIDDPDYGRLKDEISALATDCRRYSKTRQLFKAPNYFRLFFRSQEDEMLQRISARMETMIAELSNSRDTRILHNLNKYPQIYLRAHLSPFKNRRVNALCGIVFPVGLLLWLRIWRFRLILNHDLRTTEKALDELSALLSDVNS